MLKLRTHGKCVKRTTVQKLIRIICRAVALLLPVTALTGCAGKPIKDAQGRHIVWISSVNWDTNAGRTSSTGAALGSLAGLAGAKLLGVMAFDLAGRAAAKATAEAPTPGKVMVIAYNHDIKGRMFSLGHSSKWRDAWPGAEYVVPNTWAIMSEDEKGLIFLPCDAVCAEAIPKP